MIAFMFTAAGSLALYLTYLLIHGQSPKVKQRVTSTIPAAVQDADEPRASGSVSSLVTAVAASGNDPHIEDRPRELGGDAANTGTDRESVTTGSLEEQWKGKLSDEQIGQVLSHVDFDKVFNVNTAPIDDVANGADMKTKEDRCKNFHVSVNSGEATKGFMQRMEDPKMRSTESDFLRFGYNKEQSAFFLSEHCGSTEDTF